MKAIKALWLCLFCHFTYAYAQEEDSLRVFSLKGVQVTANRFSPQWQTLPMERIRADSLYFSGRFNLSEQLAERPGIRILSTGPSISKPSIRGMYGSRVLILINGLRFGNQQWQDEHGLTISSAGMDRIEVSKSPASVKYGSEAIGGLIYCNDLGRPEKGLTSVRFGTASYSNTLGGNIQAGISEDRSKFWYNLDLSYDNHGDYTDGNGKRVLNSRFKALNGKASFGFRKGRWENENHYVFSSSQSGFIFNDIDEIINVDDRLSRDLSQNPSHLIDIHLFSSRNSFRLRDGSELSLTAGVHSNRRRENEGGNSVSLDMQLIQYQTMLEWKKRLSEKHKLSVSNLSLLEMNTNLGKRKIVPDALRFENNSSISLVSNFGKDVVLENSIGLDLIRIKALYTKGVNSEEKIIDPFVRQSLLANFTSGIHLFPKKKLDMKAVLSSGNRMPNLAELSSNGLHEGIFTYEIGDPNLAEERCLSANVMAGLHLKNLNLSVNPFYTRFSNFVYLQKTNEDWYGFPVYRYVQSDVTMKGLEARSGIRIRKVLQLTSSYEMVEGKSDVGDNLPYIPAQRILNRLEAGFGQKRYLSLFVANELYLEQNKTARGESATPQYSLWNAGLSCRISGRSAMYEVFFRANNLMNEAYYDHLSRLKNFGILNMGRNVVFGFKMNINKIKSN